MKRLLCWILAIVSFLSLTVSASGEVSSFDLSVFENDEGFVRQEDSDTWMYFKGIVFNDVDGKTIQLSIQADGSDSGAAPQVRLFVLVTESGKNSVSSLGTPEAIHLFLNEDTIADIRLPDRYNNPACVSVTLGEADEDLFDLLADVQNLSLEISFEDNDHQLNYELTEKNIEILHRSIGEICSHLILSGIFTALTGSSDDSENISIDQIPAEEEVPSPTPTPAVTPVPTTVPTSTPVPTDTPAPAPASDSVSGKQTAVQSFRSVNIGDLVQFGRYPQGANQEREAVSWRVLTVDTKNRRALFLSEYGLDMISYGEPMNTEIYYSSGLNWENSYIRSWLNGEFYEGTFSEEEKKHIASVEMKTRDKTGSKYTIDRVFLLDSKEAKKYLKTPHGMACVLTDYALSRLPSASEAVVEGCCRWWLRELVKLPSRGHQGYLKGAGNEAGYVNGNHGLKNFYHWVGCPVYRDDFCAVRPALWVSLD